MVNCHCACVWTKSHQMLTCELCHLLVQFSHRSTYVLDGHKTRRRAQSSVPLRTCVPQNDHHLECAFETWQRIFVAAYPYPRTYRNRNLSSWFLCSSHWQQVDGLPATKVETARFGPSCSYLGIVPPTHWFGQAPSFK